ncbi:hypothetical protein BXZ70DRAFT_890605 [Cristinia sonorae]|uniref:NAD(P)-binding protein n=1 Tax=Cristinia sonorae TaxID=1940300 RepID=A0A8K0UTJ9_9AGAR|nr:hypothetical protein BXZ70DRAFT_890605 [Cristinia sonorae]
MSGQTRVALITGGAQGIGEAIAYRLAEDPSGIDIAVLDLKSKEELLANVVKQVQAKGRKAIAITADVTVESEVQSAIAKTVEELGSLDIVRLLCTSFVRIPNSTPRSPRWSRMLPTDAYNCLDNSAKELLPHKITVNSYAPGFILTPMQQLAKMPAESDGAKPEVVAELVAYLIKPQAYFMTGAFSLLYCCLTVCFTPIVSILSFFTMPGHTSHAKKAHGDCGYEHRLGYIAECDFSRTRPHHPTPGHALLRLGIMELTSLIMAAPLSTPRVALITGAAQGIGEAIALRLAEDSSVIHVAVCDIQAKKAQLDDLVKRIEAKGRKAISVVCDVTVEEQVKNAVEKAAEELGSLDIVIYHQMVANAGIHLVKPLLETSVEDWNKVQSVNVVGALLCYKYAAQQMIKQGRGGRIIASANISAYCASKFAIRGLTQAAALELRPHKITVNCYAPGIIETSMSHHGVGLDFPSSPPDVIAGLVAYFIRPEAHFTTGTPEDSSDVDILLTLGGLT